jgi:hypothetical protein
MKRQGGIVFRRSADCISRPGGYGGRVSWRWIGVALSSMDADPTCLGDAAVAIGTGLAGVTFGAP